MPDQSVDVPGHLRGTCDGQCELPKLSRFPVISESEGGPAMGFDHGSMPCAPVVEAFGPLAPGQEALDVDGDFFAGRRPGERNQVIHHSLRTSRASLGRIRADFTFEDAPGDADELTEAAGAATGGLRPEEDG